MLPITIDLRLSAQQTDQSCTINQLNQLFDDPHSLYIALQQSLITPLKSLILKSLILNSSAKAKFKRRPEMNRRKNSISSILISTLLMTSFSAMSSSSRSDEAPTNPSPTITANKASTQSDKNTALLAYTKQTSDLIFTGTTLSEQSKSNALRAAANSISHASSTPSNQIAEHQLRFNLLRNGVKTTNFPSIESQLRTANARHEKHTIKSRFDSDPIIQN